MREERRALRPLAGRAPWSQVRELVRRVHADACVELDTNRYSVPWRLIGERVTGVLAAAEVTILHAGQEVARHGELAGRCTSAIDRRHPHYALAALDVQAKRYDEAMTRARELQKTTPKSPAGFVIEGDVLFAHQRYANAATAYEKAWSPRSSRTCCKAMRSLRSVKRQSSS